MQYADTHVHLDQQEFAADRETVIQRSRKAGVEIMVCAGTSADSSRAALSLAQAHTVIYAAVGIQPNHCAEAGPGDWDRIVEMAEQPKVVALGETGLDRHWDFAPLELQCVYLDRHLRLAQRSNLPVILHCREAAAELLPLLREAASRGPLRGVLHAFSGNAGMAAECLELGLYVSFAGPVTYTNRKFRPLREVAQTIPDDRLLIETDSPYLVPHPLRGQQKRNEPAYVACIAECLAELRGTSVQRLSAQTMENARQLFRLGGDVDLGGF
ncbi:MAG: TatD family hydrolase [Pirellulales bacterium]|nr:TatD family hydrolase [Pirellulales bacterium]